MERSTFTQVYTYADLRRVHTKRLQAEGKSGQQIRNHDSALNQYAEAVGRFEASECAGDFTELFETNLAVFVKSLTNRGVSPAATANRVSCLRSFRLSFNAMVADSIGKSFAEVLRDLLKIHETAPGAQFWKKLGVPKATLQRWLDGRIPGKSSRESIQRLEHFFNLPPGALLGRIYFDGSAKKAPERKNTARNRALAADRYIYKTPTDAVRKEWAEVIHFHTAPYLLNGLQRNSTWRVKAEETISGPQMIQWYSKAQSGVCITACIAWGYVGRFFGYLLREKAKGGRGMGEEQLSLALLSDISLVLEFIEFKKNRSGFYTQYVVRLLNFVGSLLRKDTGFLRQQPKFGKHLLSPIHESEWDAWCENSRATLIRVSRDLKIGNHVKKGREPTEPIENILAEEHPIRVLITMVDEMNKVFVLDQRLYRRAFRKRDVLLVKMLISNPLRVHHFTIMTYRSDNSGNLYQDATGSWRLRFDPVDFKNQRGAADKEYDVLLSPWLYQDIVEYLERYRPVLSCADTSDRVFLSGSGKGKFWSARSISEQMRRLTQRYIPGCPGFGVHAFRHIAATEYIKNNPNGFQVAANILHDRLATVMREYAHIKVADGFSHWTKYLGQQLEAAGKVNHE
jgi:site-specific recombinase XerC